MTTGRDTLGISGLKPTVGLEKPKLTIGFVSITGTTPMIRAGPLGPSPITASI